MKKNIYFLEEISNLKELKRKIQDIKNEVKFEISKIGTIQIFIIEFIKYIQSFYCNNKDVIKTFIIAQFGFILLILLAFIFSSEIVTNNYLNTINNGSIFDYNRHINSSFYITLFIVILALGILFYFNFNKIFKIGKNNKIINNYGIGEKRQLIVTEINNNKFIFPKKIDFDEILKQVDFVIDLLININKIEGSLDLKNKKALSILINKTLKYNDYIEYLKMFKIDTVSKEKVYKYYTTIINFKEIIDEEINKIKETRLYKLNFGPNSKNLKKKIENRYNYIKNNINQLKKSLKNIKDIEIKKEIKENIELLEKEEKELNIIRQSYTNLDILTKKTKIIEKLNKEFNYINKENSNIKELEKNNDITSILKTILEV